MAFWSTIQLIVNDSGGESKDEFWKTVNLCTNFLPKDKPRYLMGVGFAADLVVCVALGIDMFDCVFPTRTAVSRNFHLSNRTDFKCLPFPQRFGCALVREGQLNLKQAKYALDMNPIDAECKCSTCTNYTRSYLHHIATFEAVSCSLLSVHNVAFQVNIFEFVYETIQSRMKIYFRFDVPASIDERYPG